jgi:ANTAR domain
MSDEIDRIRAEISQLRRAVVVRPAVAVVVGMLHERYRLPDPESAVALLRNVSRRHNIRLSLLADAVLDGPRPGRAGPWFRDRRTDAPPALHLGDEPASPALPDVLDALMRAALTAAGTGRGGIQLAAPRRPVLTLERTQGQNQDLLDRFARVEGAHTAAGIAHLQRRPVAVHDVAAATFYRPAEREAALDGGIRGAYVTPLLTAAGDSMGVLSVHRERAGAPTPAEQGRLDDIAGNAASWLLWYRETVLVDALNDLHARARGARHGEH